MPAVDDSYTLRADQDELVVEALQDPYRVVSTSGSNSNDGSINSPWLTIDYAVDNASPGETIYVRVGTYNERVTISTSGTAGNYITLRNYPGEYPVLDGSGLGRGTMIRAANVSYFKIINLELTAYVGAGIGIYGAGSHIEVRDNYIHDATIDTALLGDSWAIIVAATQGGVFGTMTDVIVDGNTIERVVTGVEDAYNETLTIAWDVQRFQITNNTLNNTSHIGTSLIGKTNWSTAGRPVYPRYGYIANNSYLDIANADTVAPNSGIHVDGAKDIVIEDNLFSVGGWYAIDLIAVSYTHLRAHET